MTCAARRLAVAALALLFVVMASACGSGGDPGAQQWLHGTWELTFNPDRDDEDNLVFDEDGVVRILTADNRVLNGRYQVSDNDLLLVLVVNDKPVDVSFEISPDKTRLVYRNGAYYTKKGSVSPAP